MVSKWMLKAIIQKGISLMPYREKINYAFQKHVTRGVELTDEHLGYKIEAARDHITYFSKYGETGADKKTLELGTGWYPIVPIFIYLTNSGNVMSLDIQSWMTKETQIYAIQRIKDWRSSGKLDEYFENIDEKKWDKLEEILRDRDNHAMEGINATIGLETLIRDARDTGLESSSIDFICSNNTLEHIFPDVLEDILLEFKRIIRDHGVMSHFIDMSDHFAHFDKSITVYNFLQYSRSTWQVIDNTIQPQNRLRFRDYKEMYRKAGIPVTEEIIRPGSIDLLRQVKVHGEFSGYTEKELAVTHGYLISRMD